MLKYRHVMVWLLSILLFGLPANPAAAAGLAQSWGQVVYVPVYSHIFFGDRGRTFNLSVTLSIRNVDRQRPIEVTSLQYLDENGKIVRELAPKPITIASLAAHRAFIQESDVTGGSEAAFLVRWRAAQPVHPPMIGALMVGTSFGQGISFNTSGQVLEELPGK